MKKIFGLITSLILAFTLIHADSNVNTDRSDSYTLWMNQKMVTIYEQFLTDSITEETSIYFSSLVEILREKDVDGAIDFLSELNIPYAINQVFVDRPDSKLMDANIKFYNGEWGVKLDVQEKIHKEMILNLQESLKIAGFYVPRNGLLTAETNRAVLRFRMFHPGLSGGKAVDTDLIETLKEYNRDRIIAEPLEMLVLVNKKTNLAARFKPESIVHADVTQKYGNTSVSDVIHSDLKRMFEDARKAGHILYLSSGYRDYDFQESLFSQGVRKNGYAYTNRFIAVPGQSEHQTGLAVDITAKSVSLGLTATFDGTKEYEWLMEHAYEYGFILRYPEGKEAITGYGYEPWHYRYVGSATIARYIMEEEITLEEYLKSH
ncbi:MULTISPECIES: D-alanyl-D-alanine carboxypeptidase family protein [unclassified Fusibacter]|uniref:M15 family metallopeptidase n=1 Tax=unclassified Fusibacter TaxID=2624464 RepID=UPI0010278E4E|nr:MULTISPECIES: M15 family metallopeptidase [unclassified Fusibacter]RXV60940.1 D-alanyl-D-alanine carboxypeptidase family protein [Fusibacter sp. A1]